MLLKVTDGLGIAQTIIAQGQEAVADYSGSIAATNVSQIAAVAHTTRSGFFIQNLGAHNMWINELAVATETQGSILLVPNASISAPFNYPVSTGAINIIGTAGDGYTLRQW